MIVHVQKLVIPDSAQLFSQGLPLTLLTYELEEPFFQERGKITGQKDI
jgi:hypothetical protein